MKNNLLKWILPILAIVTYSCSKDLGNYQYHDINEITINELGEYHSLLYKTDTLRLNPELTFTQESNDPDRFTYEWKLVSTANVNVNTKKGTIIGTTKDLIYPVSALPGDYILYLKIKDKETSVTWSSSTILSITVQSATGFMLIGEDDEGYTQVEMIAMGTDTVILKGLANENGVPKMKGALDIIHTGVYPPRPNNARQWIIGQETAYFVDPMTFETNPNNIFKNLLFSTYPLPANIFPVEIAPRINSRAGNAVSSTRRLVVTNTGDAFYADLSSSGGDYYGNPTNRLAGINTPTFKVAPYIMHGPGYWSYYSLYDLDNNRFVYASSSALNVSPLSDRPTDPFPWNQSEVNRTLKYAENTRNTDGGSRDGNTFALMQDKSNNDLFIYKFYASSIPQKRSFYKISPENSIELNKSSMYAFASTRTALYFVIGSKLYAYDYGVGSEKIVLIKDFMDEITMIHSDIQAGSYIELYVGTYNSTSKGTIHKMVLQNNTNTIEMQEDTSLNWNNLSKIKNMSWKNAPI